MKKRLALLFVLCMLVGLLAACSGSNDGNGGVTTGNEAVRQNEGGQASGTLNPVTLKIMIPGDRPRDFDSVVAEAEKRMAGTLNVKLNVVFVPWSDLAQKTQVALSSGEEIDLIFDAPWVHLNQMIASGYYEPLDELLAKHGPNVLSARTEQMIDANKIGGKIMAIPLGNSFMQGRVYYVRKDIREKLGVPEIKSYDELIAFAYKVKEQVPDTTPIISDDGAMSWAQFRKVDQSDFWIKETQLGVDGALHIMNNDGKVHNFFDEMDPTYWSWHEDVRKLYVDKLIYQDVLSVKDPKELYKSGKAAIFNTNDFGVLSDVQSAVKQATGGEVEAVTFQKMEPGKNLSDFRVWNFLAVPAVSKNKERAIQFMDWASQKENYDLLAYGIEGKNWEAVGDDQYKKLDDGYPWFPFAWIWNPAHDRFDVALGEQTIAMNKFTAVADNFTKDVLTGFTFDSTPVANEVAQFNGIRDKYLSPLSNGVLDPTKTWESYKSEAYDLTKKIQAEMQKQIDAFLAAQ
ncbi:extracellular solute-binding protein [Paenibacillaceae bacterium WGS1546]|uniref:extracellular solute-binding protein n=1 Tax=Cohnella sp. WGS1546 TaxID=3366810 RepID=UPI00372D565F